MAGGRPVAGPYAVAAVAALGAGCIHLAAIGAHRDDRGAALALAALAAGQLAWGVLAFPSSRPRVAVAGLVVASVAVIGWVLAKSSGIGVVGGLREPERIQTADLAAVVMSGVSAVVLARALVVGAGARVPGRVTLTATATVVAVVALLGVAATPGHRHVHGGDLGPVGHGHRSESATGGPWDPTGPVDLSGAAGVTPEEQARAERFLRTALETAPRYADRADALAAGFVPVGDAGTGVEHLVRWGALDDDAVADPTRPESLVYDVGSGGRSTLVALRYLVAPGIAPGAGPELGGPLTPWATVADLCGPVGDPVDGAAAGPVALAGVDGACPPGTRSAGRLRSLHVWTVAHACGPFAAVEDPDSRAGRSPACGEGHGR